MSMVIIRVFAPLTVIKTVLAAIFTGLTVAAPRKTWFKIATLTPLLLDVLAIFFRKSMLTLARARAVLLIGQIGMSAVQADTALDQNQKLLV